MFYLFPIYLFGLFSSMSLSATLDDGRLTYTMPVPRIGVTFSFTIS